METKYKNCRNCRYKKETHTKEPCATCLQTIAYGGKRYSKWKPRTIWQKLREGMR